MLNLLTIRARITIGSFLLATLFFAGVAIFVHSQVEHIMESSMMEILESDAAPFVAAGDSLSAESLDVPGEDQSVAIVDPDGIVTRSTMPRGVEEALAGFIGHGPGGYSLTTPAAEYRILVSPVSTTGGEWTVVTARSEAANRVILDRLTVGLAWGLAGLVALFTLASWLLTGASLRPVTRLRKDAERLFTTGSTELLDVGPARDEVSALAETLNGLISELHAAADREKQIVADASHELRTPLAILLAQLELLRTSTPESERADIEHAESAARRMSRLVTGLLELSRLDAHEEKGRSTALELVDEVASAVDRSRFAASRTSITIDYTTSDAADFPTTVVAMSPTTFGRVVDNLVGNAVAALGDTGTIEVTLSASATEVTLIVADDGPGMSPAFVARAFDRFARDTGTASSREGTGLGLAIVAAAVDAANGTVALDSSADGLRVELRLTSVHPG